MKKILSISIIAIMLTMSLKMTIAVHFCGDKVANASLLYMGNEHEGCGMEDESESCNFPLFEENSCCSDITSTISIDSEYFSIDNIIHSDLFLGLLPLEKYTFHPQSELYTTTSESIYYRPPPDLSDVSLSFIQVYLI